MLSVLSPGCWPRPRMQATQALTQTNPWPSPSPGHAALLGPTGWLLAGASPQFGPRARNESVPDPTPQLLCTRGTHPLPRLCSASLLGHGAPCLPTQSLSLKLREGGYKDKAWGVPCSASSPRSHGGSVLSCRQACGCSPHNSPQCPYPVSLALGSVLRKDTPAALVWALPSMQGHVAQTWPGDPLL